MTNVTEVTIKRQVFSNLDVLLAFGFGIGLIRPGPGTWGTILAFPVHYVWLSVFSIQSLLIFWFVLLLVGVRICESAGSKLGVPDHSGIVIDEMVAFGLVLAILPNVIWLQIVSFLIFRVFDIWKPMGIAQVDTQVKGGFGVMLDDLLAALYTIIVSLGLFQLSVHFGWYLS